MFTFGAKMAAQSDDIDNKTSTYAYVKDIKKIENHYFVTFDKVVVKHNSATGDVKIINNNKTLRTMILSTEATFMSADCNEIHIEDLVKHKGKFLKLKNKYAVPILGIENGIVMSINFGCYG